MDLLKYYNNLDVKPFLEAVLNHRKFFYDMNIDMFNIMDQIRLEQMDQLKQAIKLWESR